MKLPIVGKVKWWHLGLVGVAAWVLLKPKDAAASSSSSGGSTPTKTTVDVQVGEPTIITRSTREAANALRAR